MVVVTKDKHARQAKGTHVKQQAKGTHVRRVRHTVVLYRLVYQGKSSAHGQFACRLPVTYAPSRSVRAALTMRAATARGNGTRTIFVRIQPRHASQKAHHKSSGVKKRA